MTGARIKLKIKETGVSTAEVARRLGYEPHRLTNALASSNVKSELIEDIARVLNKKVGWFYGETEVEPQINAAIAEWREKMTSCLYEINRATDELTNQLQKPSRKR